MSEQELDTLKAKYKLWKVLHPHVDWNCDYCKYDKITSVRDTDFFTSYCIDAPGCLNERDVAICLGFLVEGNYVEHE